MANRNSVWIPIGFTVLYVAGAAAFVSRVQASDAANPGGWFHFGDALAYLAVFLVPIWILVLWLVYGLCWRGRSDRGPFWLVLTGILSPVVLSPLTLGLVLRVFVLLRPR